ncbi:MAG: biotin/lipoyl-binding protein, partial [Proteobacteria bacterium]|nr:biotin/lipoyl-binding protein [Pseudomonadota bacterium]
MTTELREERKAEQRQAPADTWPERKDPPAPEPSENEETPRRLWLWLLLGGLVFAGAAVAIWFLFYAGRENTDDAQVDGHLVWVAPKVAGHIAEVLVDDNQHVKAGQVLVRIDPRDYEVRVQRARADVLKAQSAVSGASAVVPLTRETTTSGTSSAAAQVASAEAEVIRAQAGLEQASGAELAFARANVRSKQAASERAQADLNRMRPLIAKAEISAQQFDAYVAAAKVAESELQAARERQGSAEKQVDIQRAAVQAAQTRVQQAQAGLEQSRAGQGEVAVRRADVLTAQAEVARAQAA